MINKIAETHFNELRASSAAYVNSDVPKQSDSTAAHDALNMFLSTPSFSSKQIAIESLLRQIAQGTSPSKA